MYLINFDDSSKIDRPTMGMLAFPSAVSFGNEIPPRMNGRVRINGNEAVSYTKDKHKLLSKLEAEGVPVPTPFHPFKSFVDDRGFDYPKFDNTFTYPLVIRDEKTSITITERTELLDFLKRRQSVKFVIYSIRMEEFHTARLSVSPVLRNDILILESGKRIEAGILKVDLSGPTPRFMSAMIEESFKTMATINADLGTVEMLYSEQTGEFAVSDVSLRPLPDPDPTQYLKRLIAVKAAQTRR